MTLKGEDIEELRKRPGTETLGDYCGERNLQPGTPCGNDNDDILFDSVILKFFRVYFHIFFVSLHFKLSRHIVKC